MRELVVAGLGLCLLVLAACERAEGPAPVAWDRTRCDRCSMLISEPAFAAQLHGVDGSVRHYDDPGCLLVALETLREQSEGTLWLHHHREDRWLAGEAAGFVPTAHSPMGYGLGAVSLEQDPDALSLEEAMARALAHDRSRVPLADGSPR